MPPTLADNLAPERTGPPGVIALPQNKAAELLGVNPRTLRRWELAGRLNPTRPANGVKLYPIEELKRLAGIGA